jgi:H+/Cl- antiporter ClcA
MEPGDRPAATGAYGQMAEVDVHELHAPETQPRRMTAAAQAPAPAPSPAPSSPLEMVKSRGYLVLLVFGALIGVPVAIVAYFFLKAVTEGQQYFFSILPKDLGFHGAPLWWPLPLLVLGGLLVGLTVRHLPGTGGHNPAEGFKASGTVNPIDLPGIFIAALATLCLGAVLGPEAPLILIGAGVAVLIVHLVKRDAPDQAILVIGAAGSFAAISTLLISPLAGAFLLLEAAGIGGGLVSVVLAPGLLAAGVGALIFVGLNALTGFGIFSLAVPHIPAASTPTVGEFGWAVAIGLAAAVVGTAIRRLAFQLQPLVKGREVLLTPVVGLAIGALAIVFAEATGKGAAQVLFSGQSALAPLIQHAATWSVGALVLLIVCKGLAYGASLSSFRGGPTFPGMFLGAVGGIALSHLAGLPVIDGVGMGIGAMTVVMLGGLPLTAVLLTVLFLQADAANLIPLVIVAVVVAWVASARFSPWLRPPAPAVNGAQRPPAPDDARSPAAPASPA